MSRVLLAPSAFYPSLGGIEELTLNLALELVTRGHDVRVMTHRWPSDLLAAEEHQGIGITRLAFPAPRLRPGRPGAYPGARRALFRDIESAWRDWKPDLVHAIGASWQAHHLAEAASAAHVHFILTLQGETAMDDHRAYQRGPRSMLIRSALRRTVGAAFAVTACSRWALDHGSAIDPRIAAGVVIPNGVRTADFAAIGPADPDGPVLAYGRLVHNKGFDLLAQAWQGADRPLWIGGDGPMRGEMAGMPGVTYLGRLDRAGVIAALSRCAVVALPSRIEPFGIVALEAMAAGRPVVATIHGGTGEFLRGGLLADPFDPTEFRNAIEQALASPELGVEGRRAAAALDWSIVTDRYLEAYG